MDIIDLGAPFSELFGVSPRLAESAAPAAFCCALDLAGICLLLSRRDNASGALMLPQNARLRMITHLSPCRCQTVRKRPRLRCSAPLSVFRVADALPHS